VAINGFQILYGFVCQAMELPEVPIDYIGRGWIPHLRIKLVALDGRVLIERVWRARLQRLNDQSLIEVIAYCGELRLRPKREACK